MANAGQIIMNQGDAPGTPDSGKIAIYVKDDDKIYYKTDDGTEYWITASGVVLATTLLELTDTPSAYSDGLYLKSTASGTEWATASGGGGGTSDHSALSNLDYASAGHTGFAETVHTHTGEQVSLHTTFTVDDFFNIQSAGKISGGVISDGTTSGTAQVSAGYGLFKTTDSATGDLQYLEIPATDNIVLTDGSTNYIYVDYNAGTPVIGVEVTQTADSRTRYYLGKAFREGTTLHIVNAGLTVTEEVKNIQNRLNAVDGEFVRASGMVISEVSPRYLAITAGVAYSGLTRQTTSAQDTSGTDDIEVYYRDGAGDWNEVELQQLGNTQYDNGTGTLATLNNNYYGIYWVFADFDDGHLLVVFGQGNYLNIGAAQAALIPSSLPAHISDFSLIVGKLIFQKSATNFATVESAFTTKFNSAGVTDHGNLSGLGDDDHSQYSLVAGTRAFTGVVSYNAAKTFTADQNLVSKKYVDDVANLKYNKTGGTISGNVVIEGNLTVTGTEFITHVETVEIDDNLLLINANETGGGVTKGHAGIEVDRGTETNYQFMFIEADDNFQVGISGSTQPVATRKDSADMDDGYVTYWDAANYRLITESGIAVADIASTNYVDTASGTLQDQITANESPLTTKGDVYTYSSADERLAVGTNGYVLTADSGETTGLKWSTIPTTLLDLPTENHEYSGMSMVFTAGETIISGRLVYLKSDGKVWNADASDEATMPVIGVANTGNTADGDVNILLNGVVWYSSWDFTAGGLVYMSETSGFPTQTAPTTSDAMVQVLGVALTDDILIFNPSLAMGKVA